MATQSAFTWRWSSSEAADGQAQSMFENEKFEGNGNEADNGSDGRKERRGTLLFDSQCVNRCVERVHRRDLAFVMQHGCAAPWPETPPGGVLPQNE